MDRFSKKAFEAYAHKRIEVLAALWDFTSHTGTAQVETHSSTERKIAYGEVMALESALEAFGLMQITYSPRG